MVLEIAQIDVKSGSEAGETRAASIFGKATVCRSFDRRRSGRTAVTVSAR